MRHLATPLFALLLAAAPVLANPATQINGGTMDFGYVQVPSGPIVGSFSSDGSIVADPANEGTASATFSLDGLEYLIVVGAVASGSEFVDVAVIIVRGAVAPGPGLYAIDGVNGFMFFVDDLSGYTVPADLCNTNWTLELLAAAAAGKYAAFSASVTFNTASTNSVSGTFNGMVADPNSGVMLSINDGMFNVEESTAVEQASWSEVKALHR